MDTILRYGPGVLSTEKGIDDELVPFGNRTIREVQETPWRIFYRIEKKEMVALAVLDERWNIAQLLLERLAR
jgi:hypothetical protein